MIYTDEYILSKLTQVDKIDYNYDFPYGCNILLLYNDWESPPYKDILIDGETYAIVVIDSVFVVAVSRKTSMVIIYTPDDMTQISMVNSTLKQFCQFDTIWRNNLLNVPANIGNEAREVISTRITSEMKKIDIQALEDEDNGVWSTSIEEFCNGVV